jgi:hypothetical protein
LPTNFVVYILNVTIHIINLEPDTEPHESQSSLLYNLVVEQRLEMEMLRR